MTEQNCLPPSGLCVGLDVDLNKIPSNFGYGTDAIPPFIRMVVENTRHVAAAYKVNTAFYEQYGLDGMRALYHVRQIVGSDTYCILDAKRGDIGHTSTAYARFAFESLDCDAITVAPYMGKDSVLPFLEYEGRTVYILALTSNPGSADFQRAPTMMGPLYRHVINTALQWNGKGQVGFVFGATHPIDLSDIRFLIPDIPLLIPGIGIQGGNIGDIVTANGVGPALYNASRSILYPVACADPAVEIRRAAEQTAMSLAV